MNKEFFKKLREKIRPNFEETGSHAFDHTERVCNLALKIGKKEKAEFKLFQQFHQSFFLKNKVVGAYRIHLTSSLLFSINLK